MNTPFLSRCTWACLLVSIFSLINSACFAAEKTQNITVESKTSIALHAAPHYDNAFQHFNYVNPDAPKGGLVKLGAFGSFDTLNPYTLKGEAAEGLGLLFDTLMTPSADEASSGYGLLAQSIELPADGSWVGFTLRKEATFSDGTPVTAKDVVWTFDTLVQKGTPYYRSYYADVANAEALDAQHVKFNLKNKGNAELPIILGQLPVLPMSAWEGKDFTATTLEAPIGSGPYKIISVDAGKTLTYQRRSDYWGKDLPVNRGRYNFDTIRYDYYKDFEVMFQAFKAGQLDFNLETSSRNWAVGYDTPAVKDGRLRKEMIPNQDPQGLQGFLFNARRDIFKDVRVRKAIAQLMDFEWMNANLFYSQYTRTQSYFANSELACQCAEPPKGEELALLTTFKDQLPPELFTDAITMPKSDGTGNIRAMMKESVQLLKDAGYEPMAGVMTNTTTKQPLTFEILLVQDNLLRVTQPFANNLKRLGINTRIRVVDSSEYVNRLTNFDFDMIVHTFSESLSPGNEQINYWASDRADMQGSSNYAGIKDPVIDQLVNHIVHANTRAQLIVDVNALDRVLLWGWYTIPQWHLSAYRVAYWNRFEHPATPQKYGFGFLDTWWVDPAKDSALTNKR